MTYSYTYAAETTKELDWAKLRTLRLSDFDSSDQAVRERFEEQFAAAVYEDGFLYLADTGLSQEQASDCEVAQLTGQIDEQFAICQKVLLEGNITPEEKERLQMDMTSGRFSGYKPPGFKICADGFPDNWEEFNAWGDAFDDPEKKMPKCLRDELDRVNAYLKHCHNVIFRKLLVLFSRLLGLEDDYLWTNVLDHSGSVLGNGYFKQTIYYPKPEEQLAKGGGVTFSGHKDFELITLLLSQTIAGLQVFCNDGRWRWVKPLRGSVIVNMGEQLEFLSGGHFQATRHRVVDPPSDQQGIPRPTVVIFNACRNDVYLAPLTDAPLRKRKGFIQRFEQLTANPTFPTADEYRKIRSKSVFDVKAQEIVERDGVKYRREVCGEFAVLEPI